MKSRIYLLILLISGLSLHMSAQKLSLQWAHKLGQNGWDYVNWIIPSPSGNLMLGGSLKGTVTNDTTHAELSYSNNAFLASCDTNGKLLWQKTFGGKMFDNITALARIPQGIVVSGIFQDTIRFDSLFVATPAYTGGYLALADEKGKAVWLKQTGGGATITHLLLCSNPQGLLFIAGAFAGSLRLAGKEKAIPGEKGFFLASVQPDGSEASLVVMKSKGALTLGGISSNDSLVCMAGSFSDTLIVNDTMLVSCGAEDVFVAVFTTDGKLKNLITAGGAGVDQIRSVTYTPKGEIGITGCFEYAFLMDDQMLKSNGGKDIFIAVLSPSGRLKWLRSVGGLGDDYGYAITSDNNNTIFVSGNFVSHIQLPDETGHIVDIAASNAFGNAFIAKYNASGEMEASFVLPATSEDYCKSLIAGDGGMVMVAGNFYQSMKLQGLGGQANELVSEGERDIFLLRFMDICKSVSVDAGADTSFCTGQSIYLRAPLRYPYSCWLPKGIPNHDLEVNQEGSYKLQITDEHGCRASDSITVKMQHSPLVYAGNDTIIRAGQILRLHHASSANATFQEWHTLGSGHYGDASLLHTFYTPSCSDISKGKVQLILSATNQCGAAESGLTLYIKREAGGIAAFPNPANGIVTIVCAEGLSIRSATIIMEAGNVVVANLTVNNTVMQYNLSSFPAGTYLFQLNTGTETVTKVINKL